MSILNVTSKQLFYRQEISYFSSRAHNQSIYLINFYFQENVLQMAIHALKSVSTFTTTCTNAAAKMASSWVQMDTIAYYKKVSYKLNVSPNSIILSILFYYISYRNILNRFPIQYNSFVFFFIDSFQRMLTLIQLLE